MYESEGESGYYNAQLRARQKLQYLLKKKVLAEKSLCHPKDTSMEAEEMLTTIFTFQVKFLQFQYHQMQPQWKLTFSQ